MKNIIKNTLATLSLASFLVLGGSLAGTVSAQTVDNGLCQGSSLQFPEGGTKTVTCADLDDPKKNTSASNLNKLIAQIINIFSIIVAIVAVIMIIVGGFKYITSGGDSAKVGSAKNTILYAIVGLIVVALAQFVVQFVLGRLT